MLTYFLRALHARFSKKIAAQLRTAAYDRISLLCIYFGVWQVLILPVVGIILLHVKLRGCVLVRFSQYLSNGQISKLYYQT